ncbi:MAG: PKD domain-containing protein [Fibrobacteria bacterium]|nr:PKD domain-containing protein [Fibrobacteria bacterium]
MKFPLLAAITLGLWQQCLAAPLAVDRASRTFHKDGATGVVYANLLVAYQPRPSFVDLSGKTESAFLQELFEDASSKLFTASKGAVQLGDVVVVPAIDINGALDLDPDVIILSDPASDQCPDNLQRSGDGQGGHPICADASTGGYLGLKWWESTTLSTHGEVFARQAGANVGASVAASWQTLAEYGANVLVHEFGHYLFGMRDEYEGPSFADLDAFESAVMQDPATHQGMALSDGWQETPSSWLFNGSAMGYLSGYNSSIGFSPASIPSFGAGAAEWTYDGGGLGGNYVVTEQIANVGARVGLGSVYRHGGMWSLETAVRTALGEAYSPATGGTHNTSNLSVDVYGSIQSNVFVVDRSGSMLQTVSGGAAGVTRWMAAMDFLGRLTHPGLPNSVSVYPSNAKFGLIGFEQEENGANPPTNTPLEYGLSIADLATRTTPTTSNGLDWASSSTNPIPPPVNTGRRTNLVNGLAQAKAFFDNDATRPYQRNVILISDGIHNYPSAADFTGLEGQEGNYRVFSVSVDTRLDANDYGRKMQNLALNSAGLVGADGNAFYTNGVNTLSELTQAADAIHDAIQGNEIQTFGAAQLYRDAAREYSVTTDASQRSAKFSIAWTGSVAPVLYLTASNGQTIPEGSSNGIVFRNGSNSKSFEIDLSRFAPGTWKVRVTSSASLPVTIFPSIATRSSRMQVDVQFDPRAAQSNGRLPVIVSVRDGRAIEGLQVSTFLVNRATGVTRTVDLEWNGSSYVGAMNGNLQPGINDLQVKVRHPGSGMAFYAAAENRIPDEERTPYPFFADRELSKQVWISGAATPRTLPGLEVWTLNAQPSNAQGTTLKMFVKNGTSVPLTGLKVRYFFSVTEFANGTPAISPMYLPMSQATVGTVAGRPGLAYVEFNFGSKTIQPGESSSYGQNTGEGLNVIDAQWRAPWNAANDWSAQGLKTTWSVNGFVNVYTADGTLIAGNPDLDPVGFLGDAQPIVTLDAPDLVAQGEPALFEAHAIDPEGSYLTYQWTVDGVVSSSNPGSPARLVHTFATAGEHVVQVRVDDGHSDPVFVQKTVRVQNAAEACTESNTIDLGVVNTQSSTSLAAGANCFKVGAANLVREWSWSNVHFQVNSDNGVALNGLSVSKVGGDATSLTGYSQTVPYADPTAASLYLKIQAPGSRTVRLNWWLQ